MKFNYKHTLIAGYAGYVTQAVVNNIVPLLLLIFEDTYKIALSDLTFIITVNFLIQLAVDLLSAKFVDKIGYRTSVVIAHIMCAAGLVMLSFLPDIMSNSFWGILISVSVYALGGGLIEVMISPITEACPTKNKAAQMSLLHSFYCWGSVAVVGISTLFLHFSGKGNWRILVCIWAVLPVLNALFFSKVPINTLTQPDEGMSAAELLKDKTFWFFAVLMTCAGASELSMSQWASAFAESGLGISKTAGDLAGPCMFAALMGISRLAGAAAEHKFGIERLMLLSGLLCIASYLISALCKNAFVALAGCGLCGFSVGIMWPGTFTLASKSFKNGGTVLFAFLALAGDIGCSAGPTLVGEIAGKFGDDIKSGLLFSIVFPIILVICCVIRLKKAKRHSAR